MDDGGMQYWKQLGQQQAERELKRTEILASKYAALKVACELILRDDIDSLEGAREQAKWALDRIKQLEEA